MITFFVFVLPFFVCLPIENVNNVNIWVGKTEKIDNNKNATKNKIKLEREREKEKEKKLFVHDYHH